MALARDARLYTFNSKHFAVVSGLRVREPYSRSADKPKSREHAQPTVVGIGVDINEKGMRRYAVPGVPFFA